MAEFPGIGEQLPVDIEPDIIVTPDPNPDASGATGMLGTGFNIAGQIPPATNVDYGDPNPSASPYQSTGGFGYQSPGGFEVPESEGPTNLSTTGFPSDTAISYGSGYPDMGGNVPDYQQAQPGVDYSNPEYNVPTAGPTNLTGYGQGVGYGGGIETTGTGVTLPAGGGLGGPASSSTAPGYYDVPNANPSLGGSYGGGGYGGGGGGTNIGAISSAVSGVAKAISGGGNSWFSFISEAALRVMLVLVGIVFIGGGFVIAGFRSGGSQARAVESLPAPVRDVAEGAA